MVAQAFQPVLPQAKRPGTKNVSPPRMKIFSVVARHASPLQKGVFTAKPAASSHPTIVNAYL